MDSSVPNQTFVFFRIVAPRFAAGGEARDGVITLAAPIIHYIVGWTVAELQQYLFEKKWKLEWALDESNVDKTGEEQEAMPAERGFECDVINRWLIVRFGREEIAALSDGAETNSDAAVGFMYVDHECGTTFRVEYFCTWDDRNLHVVARPGAGKTPVLVRYGTMDDEISSRELRWLERVRLKLPKEPPWLATYETPELLKLRQNKSLQRFPGHFDVVRAFIFQPGSKTPEWIIVRVEQQVDEARIVGVLLKEPEQNYGVHRGDRILLELSTTEKGTMTICVGKASAYGY